MKPSIDEEIATGAPVQAQVNPMYEQPPLQQNQQMMQSSG